VIAYCNQHSRQRRAFAYHGQVSNHERYNDHGPLLPLQLARSTRRSDISTIWLLPLSREARSSRVMMDTMFESYAQYLYLTVMRYYVCIKGIIERSSQLSSLDMELQWVGGDWTAWSGGC
jgi:hypothetical protein